MSLSEQQLRQMIEDVRHLEALLVRENKGLEGPPAEGFFDIVNKKQDLLLRLSSYGLDETSVSVLGKETVEALGRCRELNRENNLLVNQKLKVLRQINTLYRQQINSNTVALYDQMGKIVHGNNNRSVTEI